jgi:hypothetical protein
MSTDNLQDNEMDMQAKQIAGLLDAHANRLSMRTLKQLENGRERAVKAHAHQLSGVNVNRDGTLSSIAGWVEHHRMAMAGFVLAVIVAGFMAAQSFKHQESSDAYLLSADLPPEAFVDRGFEPFLNDSHAKL